MSEQTESWTEGAHHIGLTVPDLAAARDFFVTGLGLREVGAVDRYPAVFLSDGVVMITLWQARDGHAARPFDRVENLGLHHFAMRVSADRLDALHDRLVERKDVEIEFGPELLGDGPTRHMMTRIPGRIRVEFIAPTSA